MIQTISGIIFLISFFLVLLLSYYDYRKERSHIETKVTFIIPCYNDGHIIHEAVKSVDELSCKEKQIIVIDDASTDNSAHIIDDISEEHDICQLVNEENKGKAKTLNKASQHASYDTIFFVDADVTANQASFNDALARLQKLHVGAVSCPYQPRNNGFFTILQHIEYNMMTLVQGAYNAFSAIALWGGFLGVKKQAFEQAEKFSPNALTEDMDLAFKLNEEHWRVEQSFQPIKTSVPTTIPDWFQQKLRWNAGGLQCFLTHVKTWIKNPLHVFMVLSYCALMTNGTISLINNVTFWNTLIEFFLNLPETVSLTTSVRITALLYGQALLKDILWGIAFTGFSLPYVLPLIHSFHDLPQITLVIPFSLIYIPLFTITSLIAFIYYFTQIPRLSRGERAW